MKITLPNNITIEDPTTEVMQVVLSMARQTDEPVTTSEPAAAVLRKQHKNAKSSCNNKMDGRDIDLCIDYYIHDMTTKECAVKYGVSVNTIAYHIKRTGKLTGVIDSPNESSKENWAKWKKVNLHKFMK